MSHDEDSSAKVNAGAYGAACGALLDVSRRATDVANRAAGAWGMANMRPQHPMSIENLTGHAQEEEKGFKPLYREFVLACEAAREAAASFLAACSQMEGVVPDLILSEVVGIDAYNQCSVAAHILRTEFGGTSTEFIAGVQSANQKIDGDVMNYGDPGFVSHVYQPAGSISDERTCPWCAETIKAAAVICRFCGRDIA